MLRLTDSEYSEVRLAIHTKLPTTALSDTQIGSSLVLGEATDYCLGYILYADGGLLNLSAFSDDQKTAFENVRDGTEQSLTRFLNTGLVGAQVSLFRRAVLYRAAGNSVPFVLGIQSESGVQVATQYALPDAEEKQKWLYAQADEQLLRLRNLFPDDAYTNVDDVSYGIGNLGILGKATVSGESSGGGGGSTPTPGSGASFDINGLTTGVPGPTDTFAFYDRSESGLRKSAIQAILDMKDFKVVDVLGGTTPATDDFLVFSDTSVNGNPNRKATISDILGLASQVAFSIHDLTSGTLTTSDYLPYADSDASNVNKKALVSDFVSLAQGVSFDLNEVTAGTPETSDYLLFTDISANGNPNRRTTIQAVLDLASSGGGDFEISTLTVATPTTSDYLAFSDETETGNPNRRALVSAFLNLVDDFDINALTALTSPATSDTIAVYDASVSAMRKVTLANIETLIGGGFSINALTVATPEVSDEIPFNDTSDSNSNKKATISNLINAWASDSANVNKLLPTTGTTGYFLKKTATGREWAEVTGGGSGDSTPTLLMTVSASGSSLSLSVQRQTLIRTAWSEGKSILILVQNSSDNQYAETLIINPGNKLVGSTARKYRTYGWYGESQNERSVIEMSISTSTVSITAQEDTGTLRNFDSSSSFLIYSVSYGGGGNSFDLESLTVATPATGDFLAFQDTSSSNAIRKATIQNILALASQASFSIDGLSAVNPALTDYLPIADTSDSNANKKSLVSGILNLLTEANWRVSSLTTATPTTSDYLVFSDESETGDPNRKATIATILALGGGGGGGSDFSISGLTETTPVATDFLAFSDESASGDPNRKATIEGILDLVAAFDISSLTLTTTLAESDTLAVYDASTGQMRKTTFTAIRSLVGAGASAFSISGLVERAFAFPTDFMAISVSSSMYKLKLSTFRDWIRGGISGYKINSLTALTTPADTDSVAVYDVSAAAERKVTLENLKNLVLNISNLTSAGITASDWVAFQDISDSDATKRATVANLGNAWAAQYPARLVPSTGTTGYFLRKTNTGTTWAQVLGSGSTFMINDLTVATPATGDYLAFADSSDSDNNKKATIQTILNLASQVAFSIDALTAVTAATTDYIPIADTSDSNANKKTLVSSVLSQITQAHWQVTGLTTATPVATDFLVFSDESETGDPNRKATIRSILSLVEGFDISSLNPIGSLHSSDLLVVSDHDDSDEMRNASLLTLKEFLFDLDSFPTLTRALTVNYDMFVWDAFDDSYKKISIGTLNNLISETFNIAALPLSSELEAIDTIPYDSDPESQYNRPSSNAKVELGTLKKWMGVGHAARAYLGMNWTITQNTNISNQGLNQYFLRALTFNDTTGNYEAILFINTDNKYYVYTYSGETGAFVGYNADALPDIPKDFSYDSRNALYWCLKNDTVSEYLSVTAAGIEQTYALDSRNTVKGGIAFDTLANRVLILDSSSWFSYPAGGGQAIQHNLNAANTNPVDIAYDPVNDEIVVFDSVDVVHYRYDRSGAFRGVFDNFDMSIPYVPSFAVNASSGDMVMLMENNFYNYENVGEGFQVVAQESITTPALSDYLPLADISDNSRTRKTTIQSILNLASSGWTTADTAPSNPVDGKGWYDTTSNILKIYDGTTWNPSSGYDPHEFPAGTIALMDTMTFVDVSDSNKTKKDTVQDILNLGGFATKKSLFSEDRFWGSFRGSAVSSAGEWTFLNASNGVVDLTNDALTSTEVLSIRFLSIHEDVFPDSDWLNSIANQDNSTGFTQLQTAGGLLYINDTDGTTYRTIDGDYFTVTISSAGSSKTGSIYKLACTVTQTGSVWNGNAWYALNFDLVSSQKLQAQQLVDVQTLFAKVLSVQDTDQLLTMDGNGVLGNISTGTLLGRLVEKADLIGDNTADVYGGFQSAAAYLPLGTLDKRGSWSITTDTSGAPQASSYVNYTAIGNGSYTLIIGATMQKSDWSYRSAVFTASDFESGDILYIHPYDPYDASNYFKITLTGNAVLVGTGNAAYLYMPVTIVEVGSVSDPSDGWRITEVPPLDVLAGLRGRLPVAGTPDISQATEVLFSDFYKATLARLGKHIRPDTTEPTDILATFETTNSTIKNGNNLIGILNPVLDGAAQIKWGLGATVNDSDGNSIAESEIADRLNVHHDIRVSAGEVVLKGTVNNFSKNTLPNDVHYLINLIDATQVGTFTDGASVTIEISSNLVSRNEFSVIAFGLLKDLTTATPVTSDTMAFWDASAGALRKASISTILTLAGTISFKVTDVTTGTPDASTDYLVFSDESIANDPNRKAKIEDILSLWSANDLTAETSLADADTFPFYDASASAMRKITKSNMESAFASAPLVTSPTLTVAAITGVTVTQNAATLVSFGGGSYLLTGAFRMTFSGTNTSLNVSLNITLPTDETDITAVSQGVASVGWDNANHKAYAAYCIARHESAEEKLQVIAYYATAPTSGATVINYSLFFHVS